MHQRDTTGSFWPMAESTLHVICHQHKDGCWTNRFMSLSDRSGGDVSYSRHSTKLTILVWFNPPFYIFLQKKIGLNDDCSFSIFSFVFLISINIFKNSKISLQFQINITVRSSVYTPYLWRALAISATCMQMHPSIIFSHFFDRAVEESGIHRVLWNHIL